jgi:hypothetical protein
MARNTGIGLPSNLYSGGAVTLDVSPYTNFVIQTKQRQEAQDNALYKYFGDLGKNVTPAGMHSNDIPELMQKKNEWQTFNMQNKKAIARPSLDKGAAYQKSMAMYNDMLAHAAESKEKVKSIAGVGSIYKDPAKKSLLTEKTLADIQRGELPVSDPNYQRIDPTALNYNPKPFGVLEQGQLSALLNRFKGNEEVDGTPEKIPGTNQEKIRYKTKFNPDQLAGMQNIGASLYHNNPSFKQMVDGESDPLSNNYSALNDVYKSHYGKDIATPEDMATAHVLSMHPNKTGREVVRNISVNPLTLIAARNASSKNLIDYSQKYKKENEERKEKKEQQSGSVDGFVDSMFESAKNNPHIIKDRGKLEKEFEAPTTEETKKMFAYKDDKGHPVYPDVLHFSEDGKKVTPIFYKGNGPVTGNREIDRRNSRPVLVEEFKVRLAKELTGVKGASKQLGSSVTPSAPKPSKDPLKLF